jgi:hypothetical protein
MGSNATPELERLILKDIRVHPWPSVVKTSAVLTLMAKQNAL